MPVCLGIDYGLERTGLAISDPDGKIAFPLATLSLSAYGSRKALLDALASLAILKNASCLVLGLPLHMDGTENLRCRQTRNFAERLKNRLAAPIYLMPETLSTVAASEDLKQARFSRKKFNEVIDQQAACRILQSFLDLPPEKWRQA